ncbi:MAG: TIGR02444 family protein, partial [Thalassolituus sp.]
MAAKFATERGSEPTQNPLWICALKVYSQPGVEAQLLQMQDECGADILWLLTAVWLHSEDRSLSTEMLNQPEYERWRKLMILPLRQQRRSCDKAEHHALYELLKKAELEAERYGVDLLYRALRDTDGPSGGNR